MKTVYQGLCGLLLLLQPVQLVAQPAANDEGSYAYESTAGLISRFYAENHNRLFWLGAEAAGKRSALISMLQQADSFGLKASDYGWKQLEAYRTCSPDELPEPMTVDRLFTQAALAFCSDLWRGSSISQWVSYDGVSPAFANRDGEFLVNSLLLVQDSSEFTQLASRLEPSTSDYQLLKCELQKLRQDTSIQKIRQLTSSLNYYRWMYHFGLDSFIIVNISSATLRFVRHDSAWLAMKTVLGQPNLRTPRFAAYCREVTLYPYWNMPRSILLKEWLPAFKRNPGLLKLLDMEIVDGRGRVVSPASINWNRVSTSNFPYRIREKPGCLNPMGVIKFTLTSPFDVYLHDTNFKGAFYLRQRYESHGCIRIENPVGLANAVLPVNVDESYLKACRTDQKPQVLIVPHPVPVFVVYMCAEVGDDGTVHYYKDVYNLLN